MQILNIPMEEGLDGITIVFNRIELNSRNIEFRAEDYIVLHPGFRMIITNRGIDLEKEEA